MTFNSVQLSTISLKSSVIIGGIYLLKVKNKNTRTRSEICSKLTIKTHQNVFIVNFEHISHLVLAFLFLALNMYLLGGIDI